MKKLFAIIAVLTTALAMAACSSYDMPGSHEPTPTFTPQLPTPDPDSDPEKPGYWGTVIEKRYYRVSDTEWPSIIILEMNDGSVKEIVANLPPSLKWGDDVYEKSDTLNPSKRIEFIQISNISSDWEKHDSISTRTVERHYELKVSTFVQTLVYTIKEATVMINGKEEPFLTAQNLVSEGNHEFSAEKQEFEDGEKLIERELNIVKAFAKPNNSDVIEAEGRGFVDREVSKPKVEPEPAPDPDPEPTPDPESEPTPAPVVEEPTIDYYIEGIKSFVAWTMVMDGNDNFHDCRFFDCGSNFAADVDGQIFYFSKNLVSGDGYNSLNWDDKNNCWVPAVCGSLYGNTKNWYYSTSLSDGRYIDRSCDPNYASAKGNNNFSKNNNARTTWNVEAKAETSEYKGKTILTITAHKYVIDRDYKIVYSEK